MKITNETTSKEVKERMEETLQKMCSVENNKSDVSNDAERASKQIQNVAISPVISEIIEEDKKLNSFSYFLDKVQNGFSSEEYEKLSDEEAIQYYLENAKGETEHGITSNAKVLSDALQNGELQGPSIIKRWMNRGTKLEDSEMKLNNGRDLVEKYEKELEEIKSKEKIEKLYNLYLDYYKKTGYHPHPANLLALKLILKRNEFEGLKVSEGVFYNEYKESIDKSIQEVEEDFNINEEEVKSYIERKGLFVSDDKYYHDKIWHVYAEGFGMLHGSLMYTPEKNSLDIYSDLHDKSIVFAPYGINEEKPDISTYDDEYKNTILKTNRVNYKRLIKSMQSR